MHGRDDLELIDCMLDDLKSLDELDDLPHPDTLFSSQKDDSLRSKSPGEPLGTDAAGPSLSGITSVNDHCEFQHNSTPGPQIDNDHSSPGKANQGAYNIECTPLSLSTSSNDTHDCCDVDDNKQYPLKNADPTASLPCDTHDEALDAPDLVNDHRAKRHKGNKRQSSATDVTSHRMHPILDQPTEFQPPSLATEGTQSISIQSMSSYEATLAQSTRQAHSARTSPADRYVGTM